MILLVNEVGENIMKKHIGLKIFGIIIGVAAIFMATINIIPPKKVLEDNPFINKEKFPMIAAHRGGSTTNPENTLKAYKTAVNEYKIDIVESDLWLTKDNHLVYNHDGYIDRTSDVNGDLPLEEVMALCEKKENRHYISDYTLEELKQYNFGYYFTDENNNRPYKDLTKEQVVEENLQILALNDLFEAFYETNPELLFIVEIKDPGERGFESANQLDYSLTNLYPKYKNHVVIGTFHDEIEKDLKINHPSLLRGASTGAAAKFVITELLKVNLFDDGSFACLQIPTSYDLGITFHLDKKQYIERAHKRNIAVQYWTINDEKTMRELIDLGCDAIMTDNPVLLRQVLDSYK